MASNTTPGGEWRDGKRADAAFLINPFSSPGKFSTGFGCGKDTIESTAGVCFGSWGGAAVGLDLSLGSKTNTYLAPILMPNNAPIVWWNAAGSALVQAVFLGGDDVLHLNTGVGSNTTVAGSLIVGGNLSVVPGTFSTAILVAANPIR